MVQNIHKSDVPPTPGMGDFTRETHKRIMDEDFPKYFLEDLQLRDLVEKFPDLKETLEKIAREGIDDAVERGFGYVGKTQCDASYFSTIVPVSENVMWRLRASKKLERAFSTEDLYVYETVVEQIAQAVDAQYRMSLLH